MILLFGDLHGRFAHVERAVAEHRPAAIILLGDIEARKPLQIELAKVLDLTEVWFIPGNHDTDRPELIANLNGSELAHRNLHGMVAEIDGLRVAGLGGVFRSEVWWPDSADSEPNYAGYDDYRRSVETGRQHIPEHDRELAEARIAGKLLKHRSSIFSLDYYRLAMNEADVLVTHEAPSCHPHGFAAIDELARSLRARRVFHGHHHDNLDYRPQWEELGFMAHGVGLRGIKDLHGAEISPGELDAQRANRKR